MLFGHFFKFKFRLLIDANFSNVEAKTLVLELDFFRIQCKKTARTRMNRKPKCLLSKKAAHVCFACWDASIALRTHACFERGQLFFQTNVFNHLISYTCTGPISWHAWWWATASLLSGRLEVTLVSAWGALALKKRWLRQKSHKKPLLLFIVRTSLKNPV